MKRMLFIFNPNTGGGRLRSRLMKILCHFAADGYEVTVFPTGGVGDANRAAKEKSCGYDLVVCCGGDGTLNEVVDGLMHCDNPPPLGYIPGGTANDYAASLSLPRSDMLAAAERVLHPKRVFSCDVGRFDGRHFNYVAAFGAFTDVAYSTPQAFKNVLGYFAYIFEAVQKLPALATPSRMRIVTPEAEYEDDFLFGMISNSTSVAGFSFIDKDKVRMDDGLFEVLMVRQPQNIVDLRNASSALLHHNEDSPWILSLQTSHLTVTAPEPVRWTLDGEFGGETETAAIEVLPKALRIHT